MLNPTPTSDTSSPLKDACVDLVTVAHALHWFDHDRFYAEVRRVVRPSGILACWTYHHQTVSPEVDAVVRRLMAQNYQGVPNRPAEPWDRTSSCRSTRSLGT